MFGGKRKQRKTNSPQKRQKPAPTQSSPSLEDILRELTGEVTKPKPEPQPVPVYEPEPEVVKKKEESKFHDYDHNADTGSSMAEIRQEILEEKYRDFELEEEGKAIEFDVRQAIIQEAILNRPYA